MNRIQFKGQREKDGHIVLINVFSGEKHDENV